MLQSQLQVTNLGSLDPPRGSLLNMNGEKNDIFIVTMTSSLSCMRGFLGPACPEWRKGVRGAWASVRGAAGKGHHRTGSSPGGV